jgi:hypothetical protein
VRQEADPYSTVPDGQKLMASSYQCAKPYIFSNVTSYCNRVTVQYSKLLNSTVLSDLWVSEINSEYSTEPVLVQTLSLYLPWHDAWLVHVAESISHTIIVQHNSVVERFSQMISSPVTALETI